MLLYVGSLTQHSGKETEDEGEDHKDPVPVVGTFHCGNPEEDEDERLTHAAPHLQEVFDGGVGLVRDVGLHVRPHYHTTGNQTVWEREREKGGASRFNTNMKECFRPNRPDHWTSKG